MSRMAGSEFGLGGKGITVRRGILWLALASGTLPASMGCAPTRLAEGIRFAAKRHGVADASTVAVRGKAYLRFDAGLRADLEELLQPENAPSPDQAKELLQSAREISTQRTMSELDRMPPDGLTWLGARYRVRGAGSKTEVLRTALKEQYHEESKERLDEDLARLRNLSETRRFLRSAQRHLEPLPGDRGRRSRALLAAPLFIPAVIGAEIADAEATQRSLVANFANAIEYRPAAGLTFDTAADLSSLDLPGLAACYAPVFVQQMQTSAGYDPIADRIGRVFLAGTSAGMDVNVDTTQPVVYWARSEARIGDRRYDQLSYVTWYPSRPALSTGDVQAGDIDGTIIRITLDRYRRPAVYEFTRSCGCYHTLWVAEFVEAAARSEFGLPTENDRFAVQRETKGTSLFLAGLVRDDGTQPTHPTVFTDAGQHLVVAIKASSSEPKIGESVERETYTLEPYESLTRLPFGDAVASMFGSDGLVHNAGRKEGLLLAPTGMLSAGQPRQLGTMKIRMDAYDHDDPHLLEKCLRFPSGF